MIVKRSIAEMVMLFTLGGLCALCVFVFAGTTLVWLGGIPAVVVAHPAPTAWPAFWSNLFNVGGAAVLAGGLWIMFQTVRRRHAVRPPGR